MTYSSEVLADSPLVYWRLGDSSGTTMTDSSGNSRNGTYTASPTLGVTGALSGDSDTAVTFASASSQEASIAYDASWMPQSSFTLEAWVKCTGTGQVIFGRGSSTVTVGYIGVDSNGKLFIQSRTAGGSNQNRVSLASINDGAWHHVVGVRDGTALHTYVDGALSDGATTGVAGAVGANTELLYVASRGGASPARLNGSVDECAYYGAALTLTRIAAHYTAGTTAPAATGTGSLSLSGSGAAKGAATGSGSLSLSGSGSAKAAAVGTGSLTLAASGDTVPPSPAAGTGSLSLSGSGAAGIGATGSGSLSLSATGTGVGSSAATGSGSLTLSGSGSATLADSGTGFLSLVATGAAEALYVTDTSNLLNGRVRRASATSTVDQPVGTAPSNLATKYDKAVPYPPPTLVNGRVQ